MPICKCGCGNKTKTGKFMPGHYTKLRESIVESAGGLVPLDKLIKAAQKFTAGKLTADEYQKITRTVVGATDKD